KQLDLSPYAVAGCRERGFPVATVTRADPCVVVVRRRSEPSGFDDRLREGHIRADALVLSLLVIQRDEIGDRRGARKLVLGSGGVEPGQALCRWELAPAHHRDRPRLVEELCQLLRRVGERAPRDDQTIALIGGCLPLPLEDLVTAVDLVGQAPQLPDLHAV